jgi:protocatechuate 3,4-dioxygenase beta subunit
MGAAAMTRPRLALLAGALLIACGLVVAWLLAGGEDEHAGAAAGASPRVAAAPELPAAESGVASSLLEAPMADVRALGGSPGGTAELQSGFIGRIVDERGQAVGAARVELVRDAAVPGLDVTDGPAVLARTASGPDGRFAFAVAESLARVVPTGQKGQALFALLRASAPGLAARVVRVAPAASGNRDVGDVALARGARVHGRVVDEEGQPLAGARISCQHEESGGEFGPLAQRLEVAETAVDGSFSLAAVRTGRSWLRVESDGRGRLATPPFTLAPGDDEELGTLAFQPGLTLRGAVLDAAGAPLAGAAVSLELRIFGSRDVLSRTVSGAGGLFAFKGLDRGLVVGPKGLTAIVDAKDQGRLEQGLELPLEQDLSLTLAPVRRLHVRASDADGRPAQGQLRLLAKGREELARAELREGEADLPVPHDGTLLLTAGGCAPHVEAIRLAALPQEGLALKLKRESAVRGRALGPAGEPAAGLSVRADPWNGELEPVGFRASVLTDEDGRFELRGLGAGDWALRAERSSWGSARVGVALDVAEEHEAELRFEAGGTVSGRVHDARGAPRSGIVIVAGSTTGRGPRTLSDAAGLFTLAGQPPGPTTIVTGDGQASTQVTVVAGDTVPADLVVSGGVGIAGVVRSGGIGVPGARLRLTQGAARAPEGRTTDEQGQFRYEALPAGAWRIEVRRDDSLVRAFSEVNLADGEERWLELDLSGTSLAVTALRAEDRVPMPGASVRLTDANSRASADRKCGGDGTARFDDLAPGHYTLVVVADGRGTVQRELDVTPGLGVLPLETELAQAARLELSARTSDAAGFAVKAIVTALPGGEELGQATLSTAGAFPKKGAGTAEATIDHLAPGRARVTIVQSVADRAHSEWDWSVPRHDVELASMELDLLSGQAAHADFVIQLAKEP